MIALHRECHLTRTLPDGEKWDFSVGELVVDIVSQFKVIKVLLLVDTHPNILNITPKNSCEEGQVHELCV